MSDQPFARWYRLSRDRWFSNVFSAARPSPRRPGLGKEPNRDGGCGVHPGPCRRRHHGDLQRRLRGSAASAAVSGARPPDGRVGSDPPRYLRPARRPELRGFPRSQPQLRRDGKVQRSRDVGRRHGRAGTGESRDGEPGLLRRAGRAARARPRLHRRGRSRRRRSGRRREPSGPGRSRWERPKSCQPFTCASRGAPIPS